MIADILRGERVRLAALTKADLPTMAKWYENASFMRLYSSIPDGRRYDTYWYSILHREWETS